MRLLSGYNSRASKSKRGLGGPIYWRVAAELLFAAFLLTTRMGWRFTTS